MRGFMLKGGQSSGIDRRWPTGLAARGNAGAPAATHHSMRSYKSPSAWTDGSPSLRRAPHGLNPLRRSGDLIVSSRSGQELRDLVGDELTVHDNLASTARTDRRSPSDQATTSAA